MHTLRRRRRGTRRYVCTHMMVAALMQMVAARTQEDITSLHEYTFSSIRVCGLAIPLPACCEQVHRSSSRHLPDCCCDPPLLRDTTIFHSRLTSLSSVSHCVPRPPRHPRSPSPLTPLLPILTHPLPHAPSFPLTLRPILPYKRATRHSMNTFVAKR